MILREVGLRDGLQLVKKFPSTAAKQRWVRDEYGAGVRHFEVGSFLPAKTFPQFVDVRDVIATVACAAGRAWHRADAQRARRQRSAGLRRRRSRHRGLGDRRAQPGQRQPLARFRRSPMSSGCANCATPARTSRSSMPRSRWRWAARSSGAVDPKEVIRLAEKCLRGRRRHGRRRRYRRLCRARKQVGELTKAVVKIAGAKPVCVHLHDTRGMGIANASAALDAGARILDGSLGGLGGCPFAPGATGNVVFEDLVFLCESKGFATGIDIDKLVAVRAILKSEMPGETALWRPGARRVAGQETRGRVNEAAVFPPPLRRGVRGGGAPAVLPLWYPHPRPLAARGGEKLRFRFTENNLTPPANHRQMFASRPNKRGGSRSPRTRDGMRWTRKCR